MLRPTAHGQKLHRLKSSESVRPAPDPDCSPTEMRQHLRRRSVRRERYYGSVELVVCVDAGGRIRNAGRFRLEPAHDSDIVDDPVPLSPIVVENPQLETRWYWKYFLGQEHQNFAGIEPVSKAPFFLSILVEDEENMNKQCKAILWQSCGPRHHCFSLPPHCRALTSKAILQRFHGMTDYSRGLKEITNPKLQKDLGLLEDQEGCISCKFGVIYALAGQQTDVEMLSNQDCDAGFNGFLKLLGQRIQLSGWGNYKGGLDTTTNTTGRESVYTTFSEHEIMFHVSTLLPHSADNPQQIERKRHIGNDIVNIIFESGGDPANPSFNPTMMRSHFTHIFALVTHEQTSNLYRMWVFSDESVPAFGPTLPLPNEFRNAVDFRTFLLTKLINGEKAAFQAKVFVEKRMRTNDTLIKDMYIEYIKEHSKGIHRVVSDSVVKHLKSPVRKDAPGQDVFDFVKFGELVKLEKMLCGDVPDYAPARLSLCRSQPWEAKLIQSNILAWDVLSCDSWKDSSLMIVTDDTGVIHIQNGLSMPVVEQSVRVQQLFVLEHYGILLARCEKGRDAYACVFALNDVRAAYQAGRLFKKSDCLAAKIAATKGCNLLATSNPNELRLNVVVATPKRLILLRWAFGPIGRIDGTAELSKHFSLIAEVQIGDEIVAAALVNCGIHGSTRAVAAAKQSVYVVDFGALQHRVIYKLSSKPVIKSLIASTDGDMDEILFTFDNVTAVIDPVDPPKTTQEIFWTSNVNSVVYRFPYILAFTEDTIEVRLIINGNLLSTLYMPGVRLLAQKDDILCVTERNFLPFNKRSLKETKSSSGAPSSQQTKRWDVYAICAKAVEGVSPTTPLDKAQLTPHLLRNPSCPIYDEQPRAPTNGKQTLSAAPSRHLDDGASASAAAAAARGGSDSGFSSHGHPSWGDGSAPSSPAVAAASAVVDDPSPDDIML